MRQDGSLDLGVGGVGKGEQTDLISIWGLK